MKLGNSQESNNEVARQLAENFRKSLRLAKKTFCSYSALKPLLVFFVRISGAGRWILLPVFVLSKVNRLQAPASY